MATIEARVHTAMAAMETKCALDVNLECKAAEARKAVDPATMEEGDPDIDDDTPNGYIAFEATSIGTSTPMS